MSTPAEITDCYCGHAPHEHDHGDGSGPCFLCQCERYLPMWRARELEEIAKGAMNRLRRSTHDFKVKHATITLPSCSVHGGNYIDYAELNPAVGTGHVPVCLACMADAGKLTTEGERKLAEIKELHR